MKSCRHDLPDNEHDQQREEYRRADEIAPVQCHRNRVAAGLAERRRGDLDYPEGERDFGNFIGRAFYDACH